MKPVTPYHHDKEVREQDQRKKQIKDNADSKRYVKDHDVEIGDVVLVPQRKINELKTPY